MKIIARGFEFERRRAEWRRTLISVLMRADKSSKGICSAAIDVTRVTDGH
jgi:hypothetical protein